jgi:hypothetical protein
MSYLPTVAIPLKKTDDIDWGTPLKSYIAQNYPSYLDNPSSSTTDGHSPVGYESEIQQFHRMRQDITGGGKDTTGRDLLFRYYGQLDLLELRFVVNESNLKVKFTW